MRRCVQTFDLLWTLFLVFNAHWGEFYSYFWFLQQLVSAQSSFIIRLSDHTLPDVYDSSGLNLRPAGCCFMTLRSIWIWGTWNLPAVQKSQSLNSAFDLNWIITGNKSRVRPATVKMTSVSSMSDDVNHVIAGQSVLINFIGIPQLSWNADLFPPNHKRSELLPGGLQFPWCFANTFSGNQFISD